MPHIEPIARALLRRGNHILLCKAINGGYDYLPGGHIEFGESAGQALARELIEEADLPITVGPLLLVTENHFEHGGKPHHELNLVFHVEHRPTPSSPDLDEIRSREPDIDFEWVDLAAIPERDLRPIAIKAWLLARDTPPAAGTDWLPTT
jgi:8-oxo-dGTP pyrophosphatase MutT (NUDIX family)